MESLTVAGGREQRASVINCWLAGCNFRLWWRDGEGPNSIGSSDGPCVVGSGLGSASGQNARWIGDWRRQALVEFKDHN